MDISHILQDLQQYQNEGGNDWQTLVSAIQTNFSSPKTPLGLNQWQPDDKPRMEHFNEDNRKIDELIQALREELGNKANVAVPELYDLELVGGVTAYQRNCVFKTQEGVVTIILACRSATLPANMKIAALPEGFKPSIAFEIPAMLSVFNESTGRARSTKYPATVVVDTSGELIVVHNNTIEQNGDLIFFANGTFII